MTGGTGTVRSGTSGARKTWSEVYDEAVDVPLMLRWAATHAVMMDKILGASSVLEIGSGTGALSAMASKWADLCCTVDIDTDVLQSAGASHRKLHATCQRVQGDGFALPFGDGAFDVSFSQGLLEHFSDADVLGLLREQVRVSRLVLASVPTRSYPHVGTRGPGLIGNERLLTAQAWRTMVAPLGATVVNYRDPKVLQVAGVALGPRNHALIEIRVT